MRWFKHFNDALDDPFIQELMDKFSHAGYVAWFGLLEIIAKENGTKLTGKLTVDPRYLKRKLRISTRKLEQIFEFCSGKVEENLNKTSTKPKLLFNKTSEKWNFEVCKMMELKDNYTKDLQASSKKPSNQKEAEAEEDNNPPTPLLDDPEKQDDISKKIELFNRCLQSNGVNKKIQADDTNARGTLIDFMDVSMEDHRKVYSYVSSAEGWNTDSSKKFLTFKTIHKHFKNLLEQAEILQTDASGQVISMEEKLRRAKAAEAKKQNEECSTGVPMPSELRKKFRGR